MSLIGWVNSEPVFFTHLTMLLFPGRGALQPWLPSDQASARIVSAPRTGNFALVGTAFDYALRMRAVQLNRLSPSALSSGPLVASLGARGDRMKEKYLSQFRARWDIAAKTNSLESVIPDCLVLAKLDSVYRSGVPISNDGLFQVERLDVEDLQDLVAAINPDVWRSPALVLNPTFGGSSFAVGGADADIVKDGTIIDIKTTKYLDIRSSYLHQLVGYYILNQLEGDPFKVTSLGIYFSRYAVLWSLPVHPDGLYAGAWPQIRRSLRKYARGKFGE